MTKLTRNQLRGFWAAWAGWMFDGMDSLIYALVLLPSLTELLPRSGIAATPANIGLYGGTLFALFLVGWGLSSIWGPIADRYGRVPTLMVTILCYSIFTFLGATATTVWQLAFYRLLAGAGIGGEWSIGGTFVAEEWPEERRKLGAGLMHTGYYVGFFIAGIANAIVGTRYGWRAMFVFGGVPALLVGFIRYGVRETSRWEARRPPAMGKAFMAIFSPAYARRTLVNSLLMLASIIGLWAGSVYVPTSVIQIATREGRAPLGAARLASFGTMILAAGTILGCVALPFIAEKIGRRPALAIYFAVMGLSIAFGFGVVFYMPPPALGAFLVVIFFLGIGGANFAMYTLWLPEQYPTDCRASAFAFITSVGRFAGAGITFLVGAGIAYFHTLGKPIAFTAIAFGIGLLLLPFAEETRGQPLPT